MVYDVPNGVQHAARTTDALSAPDGATEKNRGVWRGERKGGVYLLPSPHVLKWKPFFGVLTGVAGTGTGAPGAPAGC